MLPSDPATAGAALMRDVGGLAQLPLQWVCFGCPPPPPRLVAGSPRLRLGSARSPRLRLGSAGGRGEAGGKEAALGEAREEPLLGVKARDV